MDDLAFHKHHRVKQAADQRCLFSSDQKQLENIRLDFDISDEPMMVNGDPDQIQQCILNLITNARHTIEEKSGGMGDGEEGHIKFIVRCGEPAENCNSEYLMSSGQFPPLQCVEIRVPIRP